MAKSPDVLILMLHGIGINNPTEFGLDVNRFELAIARHHHVHEKTVRCHPIYWGGEIEARQGEMFFSMMGNINQDDVGDFTRKLRHFAMLNASDALTLEHRAEDKDSAYHRIQRSLRNQIDEAYTKHSVNPDTPVIVIGQSLGAHILSSYIWDAQAQQALREAGESKPALGIFTASDSPDTEVGRRRRLKTMQLMLTTGCNIPLFVAGKNHVQAIKSNDLGYNFKWYNFFYTDDPLGWPLSPLAHFHDAEHRLGQSYQIVRDVRLSDGDGSVLEKIRNNTPASHTTYWTHQTFIDHVSYMIRDELRWPPS